MTIGTRLHPHILDELLTTLDVRLHAFALCRIGDGFRLAFESMEAVVIHYVLRGEGRLHQEGYDSVAFGPGQLMIVAPGRSQSLSSGLVTQTVTTTDVCGLLTDGLMSLDANDGAPADLLVVCGTITATYGGGFGLFDHQTGPIIKDSRRSPDLMSAFDLLLRELSNPRMGSRALAEALMKTCLILVLRDEASGEEPSPILLALKEPRLAGAVRAILAQPGAAHTLEGLAAAAGMSRSVFAARFFAAYAQTPFEFVATVRLRSAARLLTISDMPVKGIARSVGYASRSHFSRAFRSAFKMDPSSYRRLRAANDELESPLLHAPAADKSS